MNYNHKTKNPARRRITWGEYRGNLFEEVPTEYLQWFVKNAYTQLANRREWSIQELLRRGVDVPNHKKPHAMSEPDKKFKKQTTTIKNLLDDNKVE